MTVLVPTPPGAALYKLVCIKPADDLSLAPYEDFGALVFWYDPDPFGHSSGIKPVYPQPSPVCVGKIMSALIQNAEPPAPDVSEDVASNGPYFVHGTENQTSCGAIGAQSRRARASEHSVKSGRLLGVSEDARLFHRDLSPVNAVSFTAGMSKNAPPIARQDD